MKTKLLLLMVLCMFVTLAEAQTKIGDNPAKINAGSVLELESTEKGLLLPRIKLDDVKSWTLAGTPTHGMLIYNESGSQPVGLYWLSGRNTQM